MKKMRRFTLCFIVLTFAVAGLSAVSPASAWFHPPKYEYSGADPYAYLESFCQANPMREAGSKGEADAAEWLAGKYTEFGYKPLSGGKLTVRFSKDKISSQNVLAWKPAVKDGKEVPLSEDNAKFAVLSAHCDNAAGGKSAGYQGAYDNGTGVATLLAIAENLKDVELPFHLVVANFGAEETGLYGSQAFFSDVFSQYESRALVNVNLDVVGGGKNLYLYTDEVKNSLDDFIRQTARELSVDLTENPLNKKVALSGLGKYPYSHVGMMSDNIVFDAHGIPTAAFFSYDWNTPDLGTTEGDSNALMHTQEDSVKNLPASAKTKMEQLACLVTGLVQSGQFVYQTENISAFDYSLLLNGWFSAGLTLFVILGGGVFVFVKIVFSKKQPPKTEPPQDPFEEEKSTKVFEDFE